MLEVINKKIIPKNNGWKLCVDKEAQILFLWVTRHVSLHKDIVKKMYHEYFYKNYDAYGEYLFCEHTINSCERNLKCFMENSFKRVLYLNTSKLNKSYETDESVWNICLFFHTYQRNEYLVTIYFNTKDEFICRLIKRFYYDGGINFSTPESIYHCGGLCICYMITDTKFKNNLICDHLLEIFD